MIRTFTIATTAAACLMGMASGALLPATAQAQATGQEQARTTYRIEFLKLKPGATERWTELGEKYFAPATKEAGMDLPDVHWLMSGRWDVMMVFKMKRGMGMLDSHNPPERVAFRKAMAKVAGSEEAAKKIFKEEGEMVADSMVIYSHTHR